jgi:exopolysaccharide production protein ExoZ
MNPPTHRPNLDVLRALAVLSVVAHHLHVHTGLPLPYLGVYGGMLGVQLFFVLSGYLISASAAQHSLRHDAVHRVMRIFPAYWVAFALLALMVSWRLPLERITEHPGAFLLSLANLQQLYAVALLEMDVLSVSWTLTVEVLWYAVAPLVLLATRRSPWATFVSLLCISTVWTFLASRQLLTPLYAAGLEALSRPPLPGQLHVLIASAFPAQLVFFGLGGLVFHFRERLHRLPMAVWPATAGVCLAALPWTHAWPMLSGPLGGLGLTALFVWLLRSPDLPSRFLQFTGRISYSIYLLHFPIIVGAYKRFGHLGTVHLVITLALIFGLAWLLYRWVERPGMALARRWTRPVSG